MKSCGHFLRILPFFICCCILVYQIDSAYITGLPSEIYLMITWRLHTWDERNLALISKAFSKHLDRIFKNHGRCRVFELELTKKQIDPDSVPLGMTNLGDASTTIPFLEAYGDLLENLRFDVGSLSSDSDRELLNKIWNHVSRCNVNMKRMELVHFSPTTLRSDAKYSVVEKLSLDSCEHFGSNDLDRLDVIYPSKSTYTLYNFNVNDQNILVREYRGVTSFGIGPCEKFQLNMEAGVHCIARDVVIEILRINKFTDVTLYEPDVQLLNSVTDENPDLISLHLIIPDRVIFLIGLTQRDYVFESLKVLTLVAPGYTYITLDDGYIGTNQGPIPIIAPNIIELRLGCHEFDDDWLPFFDHIQLEVFEFWGTLSKQQNKHIAETQSKTLTVLHIYDHQHTIPREGSDKISVIEAVNMFLENCPNLKSIFVYELTSSEVEIIADLVDSDIWQAVEKKIHVTNDCHNMCMSKKVNGKSKNDKELYEMEESLNLKFYEAKLLLRRGHLSA